MWSILRFTDFREAFLLQTNLSLTNLSAADLSGALIGQTVFASVDLQNTKGLESIAHMEPSSIDICCVSELVVSRFIQAKFTDYAT
jgi:uncharacterized protein YjbI with pentapeptide repeats